MTEIKQPESCDPKYVWQNLGVLKTDKSKFEYLADTLKRCSVVSPIIKKKRGMSGYNCFVKVSVKKGQPFKEVIKSRAWSQLEPKAKETWNRLAKNEGCSPRLWE